MLAVMLKLSPVLFHKKTKLQLNTVTEVKYLPQRVIAEYDTYCTFKTHGSMGLNGVNKS